jgi:predicted nucleic acid-binding Zn ribbon protein
MDCPKCGTWNPDDKRVCWRCQAEMPKPVEKKKKQPVLWMGLPVWAWALLVMLFILFFGGQCLAPLLTGQ